MATPSFEISQADKKFISWHLVVAVFALGLGSLFGPLQAFQAATNLDLYKYLKPIFQSYFQGLTIHGVLNALVWTTFFITGFLTLTTINGLKRPLRYPKLNYVGFGLMVLGLVITGIPILLNEASVLYTFYPPLKANWAFYLGLTLVVVGSWVEGYGMYFTYYTWRKENPGVRTPLMTFGGLVTMVMWQIATLGIAVEILTMLLPWSLGLIKGVDPQLARTYFWFTGHPLVYFWLLPAYLSWYTMLPKQVNGKLFSETLARLAFWLFLVLSVPLGFHHQFVDPGVPPFWKFLHATLTYLVAFPSMMTAFTVIASLEYGARQSGGKGLLGWLRALPWGDASVSAQLLAGILFFFGGIGGITNASYNINLVIHNTAWVPGHFHLTVSSAVTLSFMGITYWLVPFLTGKKLWNPTIKLGKFHISLATLQAWTWFVGMIIFSNAMHTLGLLGAPRRTPLGLAPYIPDSWNGRLLQEAIGGGILLIGAYAYIVIMVATALSKQAVTTKIEIPAAESLHDSSTAPAWIDQWAPWLVAAIALILIAYGPQLIAQISNMALTSPGFRVW